MIRNIPKVLYMICFLASTGDIPPLAGDLKLLHPYPTVEFLWDVQFVTEDEGWVIGNQGTILYTQDGGEIWSAQESGSRLSLFSIAAINDSTAWIVGGNWKPIILSTTNSGDFWETHVLPTDTGLSQVEFVDAEHGWIVNTLGEVFKTSNGGVDWEQVGKKRKIEQLAFINPKIGFAVSGTSGYAEGDIFLLQTSDAGRTWDEFHSSEFVRRIQGIILAGDRILKAYLSGRLISLDIVSNKLQNPKLSLLADTEAIDFIDSTHGVVFNGCCDDKYFTTLNAGDAWTSGIVPFETNSLNAIDLVSEHVGYAVCGSGMIMKTLDGGRNWEKCSRGQDQSVRSFYAIDSSNLWAGGEGYVISSSDGGNNWHTSLECNDCRFDWIFFNGPDTGLAVERAWNFGREHTIYVTSDGGATWKTQDESSRPTITNFFPDQLFLDKNLEGWMITIDNGIWNTAGAQSEWKMWRKDTSFVLYDAYFDDPSRIWLVGGYGPFYYCSQTTSEEYLAGEARVHGRIIYTSDGGETWRDYRIDTIGALQTIHFLDEKNGWCAGYDSPLYGTRDGGSTWIEITDTLQQWQDIHFFDESIGVAIIGRSFHETSDGGLNWSLIKDFYRSLDWINLNVLDKNNIWLYGDHGAIYRVDIFSDSI